jgi:hypothetical protein
MSAGIGSKPKTLSAPVSSSKLISVGPCSSASSLFD